MCFVLFSCELGLAGADEVGLDDIRVLAYVVEAVKHLKSKVCVRERL